MHDSDDNHPGGVSDAQLHSNESPEPTRYHMESLEYREARLQAHEEQQRSELSELRFAIERAELQSQLEAASTPMRERGLGRQRTFTLWLGLPLLFFVPALLPVLAAVWLYTYGAGAGGGGSRTTAYVLATVLVIVAVSSALFSSVRLHAGVFDLEGTVNPATDASTPNGRLGEDKYDEPVTGELPPPRGPPQSAGESR